MKKIYIVFVLVLMGCYVLAQNDTTVVMRDTVPSRNVKFTKKDYIPKFTATVLGRYEYNTNLDAHHFELRHARVGVSGSLHPMFSYMALMDLTFGGKISPVAIFAQFKPIKGLSLLIGYDKMPFSTENLLSPYQYYFSDKSFLTQKISAWSDVGAVIAYKWDKVVPFEIKAGVFNTGGFSQQMAFQKRLNYVARGQFNLFKDFNLTLNYAAVQSEYDEKIGEKGFRMHNYDVGVTYDIWNFHLDAEYIYKRYADSRFEPTHAFQGFAYYKINIGKKLLDNIALAMRYDAITNHCNGKLTDKGYVVDPFRQRLTAGLTLVFVEKPVRGAIRINYEKNFVSPGVVCDEDRLIFEIITHI